MTRKPAREARRSNDSGFTLVELLVVVVILAVLSAVVVFAVRGSGDEASKAALDTDERVIRTAEEAYCANKNRYADMGTASEPGTLVGDRYLSEPSRLHDATASNTPPTGPCNGYGYTISRRGGSSNNGGVTTTSPSTSTTLVGELPLGRFEPAGAPPHPFGILEVALPTGKVLGLSFTKAPTANTDFEGALSSYDPLTNVWLPLPHPPCIGSADRRCGRYFGSHAVALRGSPAVCGANCGSVLMRFETEFGSADGGLAPRWILYNPSTGSASETIGLVFNPESAPSANLLWSTECERSSPPSWCGNVLVAGGGAVQGLHLDDPASPFGSQLYDPRANTWRTTGPLSFGHKNHVSSALADGRVLVMGGRDTAKAEVFDPRSGDFGAWTVTATDPLAQRDTNDSYTNGTALLADGRVLVAGNSFQRDPDAAEIFDPRNGGSFSRAPGCDDCLGLAWLTALPGGKVLVITSLASLGPTNYPARLWDPAASPSGSFADIGHSRLGYGTALITGTQLQCGLNCGKVVVVSRFESLVASQAELYAPAPTI